MAEAAAAVDVDVNVDRVLVGQAGVRGRWRRRGQDVGQVNGDSQAVRPGNASRWLPRWRSMRQPCASATKASRGWASVMVVRQGRANGTCGCSQRQAKARRMTYYQVLCTPRSAAPATAACELGLSGSGEA